MFDEVKWFTRAENCINRTVALVWPKIKAREILAYNLQQQHTVANAFQLRVNYVSTCGNGIEFYIMLPRFRAVFARICLKGSS